MTFSYQRQFLLSTMLLSLCFGLAAQPPLPKVAKPLHPASVAVKGGQALAARPAVSLPPPASFFTIVTVAWNPVTPAWPGPWCYVLWGSIDLVNWLPVAAVPNTQTAWRVTQTNQTGFFYATTVIQSPPSNIITNTITLNK